MRIVLLVLFAAIPAFRAASSEPVRMTGEVLIQNNGPKTVLAFVQPNSGGVSQVLRLTAHEPFPQNPVAFHFDDAEVVLDADHAAIVSRSSDVTIVFALSEPMNPEPAAASDVLPERDETKGRIRRNLIVLSGVWLSRHEARPGLFINGLRRPQQVAAEFCEAWNSGDDCLLQDDGGTGGTGTGSGGNTRTCDSGGHGSTQCSTSVANGSCSVACASGYYACCSNLASGPSCICVRN